MKRILLIVMAVMALVASCKKEKKTTDDSGPQQTGNTSTQDGGTKIQLWARTPGALLWKEGDALGLYTSDDFNSRFEVDYLEEGKEDRG